MKKTVSILLIGIMSASILVGCSNKKEPIAETNEREEVVVDDVSAEEPVMEEEITETATAQEDLVEGPDLRTITEEEFYNLPVAQLAAAVESQIPDYRDKFSISEDMEMTDDAWEALRPLLFYSLFGKDIVRYEREAGITTADVTVEEDENSEYLIGHYTENELVWFDREYLESLTDEEFFDWLDAWMEFTSGKVTYLSSTLNIPDKDGNVARVIEAPDRSLTLGQGWFKYATEEEIPGIRAWFIQKVCQE